MTHWFHRNPLKATAPVSFNYYGVATTPAATKVCNDLRLSRTRLLELFTDSSCNPEMMKNAADLYFSLLQGFILSLDDSSQECKLRYIQNFKWTDTLQGQVPSAQQDAVFELVSMGFNVALWYTKYASRLAGKEDITEDEAKDVHRSLKIAAGIFKHLKESHIAKLITPVEKGRDLEARLLDSYIIQCQAEAQEVTIARAIELKHNPGLIAALAYETANFYQKADQTLSSLDPAYAGKWRKYLNLKSCFYMAYVSTLGGSSHSLLSVCQVLHREWGLSIALAFCPHCEEELCSVSDIKNAFLGPKEIAAVWVCCDHKSLIEAVQAERNGHLCYLHHDLILGTVQS